MQLFFYDVQKLKNVQKGQTVLIFVSCVQIPQHVESIFVRVSVKLLLVNIFAVYGSMNK